MIPTPGFRPSRLPSHSPSTTLSKPTTSAAQTALVVGTAAFLAVAVALIAPDLAGAQQADDAPDPLESATIVRDVDYVPDEEYADGRDLLDIYMPENAAGVQVLVFFHGGELMYGSKAQAEEVARRLLPLQIGVVSANYRLSPDHMHPAHIQDAATATAWVLENIGEYGGNPENVFVGGHSAGGYLATLLGLDESRMEATGHSFEEIRGVVAISPFLYVETTAPDRDPSVWGEDPEQWRAASVTPHIEPGKRPMLLFYADGDAPWRKAQIDRFSLMMAAQGNTEIAVLQAANRDHVSLIDDINEPDDRIGGQIEIFMLRNRVY